MHSDGRTLLLSLRPRFAELLLQGTKTVELRRVQPDVGRGTLVLLYASSPMRALVGTSVVEDVQVAARDDIWRLLQHTAGFPAASTTTTSMERQLRSRSSSSKSDG